MLNRLIYQVKIAFSSTSKISLKVSVAVLLGSLYSTSIDTYKTDFLTFIRKADFSTGGVLADFFHRECFAPYQLDAGGKPSTWFPPGRLVEHINLKTIEN